MEDFATMVPPFCTYDSNFLDDDCGGAAWARTLFILWNIISMYIFVSLFVSLIFESFSYVYQRSSGLYAVSREEIRRFKQAWATYDPNGTGYVTKEQFPRLLGVSGFSMFCCDILRKQALVLLCALSNFQRRNSLVSSPCESTTTSSPLGPF